MSDVDLFVLNLAIVLIIGLVAYLFSEKTSVSSIPILILLGWSRGLYCDW